MGLAIKCALMLADLCHHEHVALFNLGTAYGILGDRHKQVKLQERALALRESAFGMNHLSLVMILEGLADAYWALADGQKRLSLLERIMIIKRGIYSPNHLQTTKTLVALGNAARDCGGPKPQSRYNHRHSPFRKHIMGRIISR